MDVPDGLISPLEFRQGAPKKHLVYKFLPAVKERDPNAET